MGQNTLDFMNQEVNQEKGTMNGLMKVNSQETGKTIKLMGKYIFR